MKSKHDLITELDQMSKTDQHEAVVECLDYYSKGGTIYLTAEEIARFIKIKKNEIKNERMI